MLDYCSETLVGQLIDRIWLSFLCAVPRRATFTAAVFGGVWRLIQKVLNTYLTKFGEKSYTAYLVKCVAFW